MLRFSANISTLFTELPVLQRPRAAADAGFRAIEMQSPYEVPLRELAAARERAGVEFVLINMPAGDPSAGELGLACIPGRQEEFAQALRQAITTAQGLGCRRVHALAGNLPLGKSREHCRDVLVENLRLAAARLDDVGIQLLLEPLNAIDHPRFLVTRIGEGDALLAAVDHRNLALQYDVYHRRAAGEAWLEDLAARVGRIGHIQFSDYPGRHEPGSGELDFLQFFELIGRLPYSGWTGAEYRPSGATAESLRWFDRIAHRCAAALRDT